MQKYTIDMTVGLVLLLLVGFGSCDEAKERDCPSFFEKVDGIPGRCFYYYEGPTTVYNATNNLATVNFSEALDICKGKHAKVFEPQKFNDGGIIYNYVREKRNGSYHYVWVNYRDINDTVSFVGTSNSIFMESTYMGSLSTLGKLPTDWWNIHSINGTYRYPGYHCATWTDYGVTDRSCAFAQSLVCESEVSSNLKEYINNLNGTVAKN